MKSRSTEVNDQEKILHYGYDNLKSNKKDEQDNCPIRLFRFKLNSNFKQKFFPLTSAFIRATNHSRKGKSKRRVLFYVHLYAQTLQVEIRG